MEPLIGAVELGGTKSLAAVATDPLSPLRRVRVPTADPETTLERLAEFLSEAAAEFSGLSALGIASFGPLRVRRDRPDRGTLLATPKPGWTGANVVRIFERRLGCPVALDTDVNGAALAETRWGAARGLSDAAYLTVGTGLGGGLLVGGRPVHGRLHPEIGHVAVERHPDDPYPGICPYHGGCAEGLASGPAIMARFGRNLAELGPDHPFRPILAEYLGQVCALLLLAVSPERIVIGGGVMASSGLHGAVEEAMRRRLAGYAEPPAGEPFVVPPALGEAAGLYGAFALAQSLL